MFRSNRLSWPKGLVAIVLVLSVAAMTAGFILGLHVHVLPNGRILVHSHPTDAGGGQKGRHDHSERDYVVLAGLGKLLGDVPASGLPATGLEALAAFLPVAVVGHICSAAIEFQPQRSPPSLSA